MTLLLMPSARKRVLQCGSLLRDVTVMVDHLRTTNVTLVRTRLRLGRHRGQQSSECVLKAGCAGGCRQCDRVVIQRVAESTVVPLRATNCP